MRLHPRPRCAADGGCQGAIALQLGARGWGRGNRPVTQAPDARRHLRRQPAVRAAFESGGCRPCTRAVVVVIADGIEQRSLRLVPPEAMSTGKFVDWKRWTPFALLLSPSPHAKARGEGEESGSAGLF